MNNDKRIKELAYQIWESEGRPHGQSERHWEMARKLAASEGDQSAPTVTPSARNEPKSGGRSPGRKADKSAPTVAPSSEHEPGAGNDVAAQVSASNAGPDAKPTNKRSAGKKPDKSAPTVTPSDEHEPKTGKRTPARKPDKSAPTVTPSSTHEPKPASSDLADRKAGVTSIAGSRAPKKTQS